jgi:transcriptional regulator with XRE-family HTH domain
MGRCVTPARHDGFKQHEVAMARCPVDALIGEQIRALRLARGLSQSELGALIGATADDMAMFESGARRVGARRIVHIARALEVDVGALFGQHGEPAEDRSPRILRRDLLAHSPFPSRAIH